MSSSTSNSYSSENELLLSKHFFKTTDKYKFVKRWASGIYRTININCRQYEPSKLYELHPYVFYFVKEFIEQFYTQGLGNAKEDILEFPKIYRGIQISTDLNIKSGVISDNSFMSFTSDYDIADKFATKSNSRFIFTINTKSLPDNMRCFLINDKIQSIFGESEIVLLPGTLRYKYKDNLDNVITEYTPNINLINYYMNSKTPKLKELILTGGGANNEVVVSDFKFAGKTAFFYRAIDGRTPEVLTIRTLSKSKKYLQKDLDLELPDVTQTFMNMLKYMPEVKDLIEQIHTTDDKKLMKIMGHKVNSYTVHTGIYDPKTHTIMTLNTNLEPRIFNLLFPYVHKRREEITQSVLTYFEKNPQ